MRRLWTLAVLLLSLTGVAQSPEVICPTHNVPALFTGHDKKDGEGRTVAYEYCHGTTPARHCFWAHN